MLFLAYAIMVAAIWGSCAAVSIHLQDVWVMVAAIIGTAVLPEMKRQYPDKKSNTNEKPDLLDVNKGGKSW